jgi:hypothetical protein
MTYIQNNYELHVCMGLNSCKNQGYSGNNDCAGMGDCSTVEHSCHTLNECKGQGGCGLFGTTQEFCHPSENDCRYQGSCGAPILASRFIAQGPNKGRSVWQLARKRFEEKRTANNQLFGQPPAGPYGPSNAYVNQIKNQPADSDNSSCGQSGSRHCSYIADPTQRALVADARVKAMEINSAAEMDNTLSTCPPNG